jgi:hypothetical protein
VLCCCLQEPSGQTSACMLTCHALALSNCPASADDGSAVPLQRCLVSTAPKAVLDGKKVPEPEHLLPWHALQHTDPAVLQLVRFAATSAVVLLLPACLPACLLACLLRYAALIAGPGAIL